MRRRATSRLHRDLRYIRSVYGIRVDFKKHSEDDPSSMTNIKRLSLSGAVKATGEIRDEISKYPPEVIRYSSVNKIRLLKDFLHNKEKCGGVAFTDSQLIFILRKFLNPAGGTFHHELYHHLDAAKSRLAVPIPVIGKFFRPFANLLRDRNWQVLNSRNFNYSKKHYKPTSIKINDGFADSYGMINIQEDRSTVAEMMMCNPKKLAVRVTWDNVLKSKAVKIMELLNESSDGLMDEAYFKALFAGNVKPGYWDSK